jgi:hypothetical protein
MARPSLVAVANRHVPFPTACRWAGIEFYGEAQERGTKVYCPFGEFEHPDGGREPALRIYPDHGWCFAENRYFSPVSLLADVWRVSRDDAAAQALDKAGYVPADYAHLWEHAQRVPPPDRDALAQALTAFCEGVFPDWRRAQYDDPRVRTQLARCLGLLPLVETEEHCKVWLDACKRAMLQVMPPVQE